MSKNSSETIQDISRNKIMHEFIYWESIWAPKGENRSVTYETVLNIQNLKHDWVL